MYGYIYETRFGLHPDWVYYGQHKCEKFDESYHGSGKVLYNYVLKYGDESLSTRVLQWCETKEELDEAEKKVIAEGRQKSSDIVLNITSGGSGGDTTSQYKWYTDGINDIYLCEGDEIPLGYELGRSSMRGVKFNSDTIWINNGEVQKHIKKSDITNYPDWNFGMLYRGDSWRENIRKSKQNLSEEARRNLSDGRKKYFQDNYQPGEKKYWGNSYLGRPAINKGRISITNGIKNRYIKPDEEIPEGWHRGSTQNRKRNKLEND